ncbi:glycosyltransferase, partial [uncultured Escherichia sp.]
IQSVGGYKKHLLMEDYNLWLRLLNNGYKIYNLPEILVYARTGINMVRKRRGMSYFKSEIQLFKLKRMLNCNSYSKNCVIFLIRVLPRFLPVSVLSIVYKIMRK